MPRVRGKPAKRQVYWWTEEIAALRENCVNARRQYTRHRRRTRNRRTEETTAREAELYEIYRAAKKSLQQIIKRAKTEAREELLATLDRDPWGRPYRMVRNKLRPWAPPLTQSLQPQLREQIVAALFPNRPEHIPPAMAPPPAVPNVDDDDDGDIPEVTRVDLDAAVRRLKAKNTAPGPDGIPGRAWVLALEELGPRLRGLFSACLERGQFPQQWKTGKLVLIKKEGRPADSPSAFRPIVLLDEVAKLFERIIANRLVAHLNGAGPDLAENQFGFRRGRSTVDAIMRVRALTEDAVARGEVVLAVSLDIANAFNTLPWSCVREALAYHRVPIYLRRIIGAYLSERFVVYPGQEIICVRREVTCGVPQGSVLGPLLWNIGYDWVLRGELLRGVGVVCYADDTLVVARGKTHREAAILATAGVAQVVSRIRRLGLEVALHKSEALSFHKPRKGPPPGSSIMVGGVRIGVESTMKYLGLVLDSRWNFGPHFRRLVPKLMGAAAALSRLLPNLGGPDASCRRLYTGVVRSMALYGAPVWAPTLTAQNAAILRQPQRAMAVRVIRGYRTISFEAASLLAGTPPWDLDGKTLASHYLRREEEERSLEERRWEERRSDARRESREILLAEWRSRLERPSAGHAAIAAVRPILKEWLERRHGALSYRLTQVLSGHGCFGKYLHRIGREEDARCHHCGCPEDTAEHTLEECSAWTEQRRALTRALGVESLSLPAMVLSMTRCERSWEAAASFCEEVMLAKEAAERERETTTSLPARRRRTGRRRALNDLRPP